VNAALAGSRRPSPPPPHARQPKPRGRRRLASTAESGSSFGSGGAYAPGSRRVGVLPHTWWIGLLRFRTQLVRYRKSSSTMA